MPCCHDHEQPNLRCPDAEVARAVRARKEEKQRKAQQLLESRQGVARGAAEGEDDDDDEAALDASLDQVTQLLFDRFFKGVSVVQLLVTILITCSCHWIFLH
jgi:hypothetical protein